MDNKCPHSHNMKPYKWQHHHEATNRWSPFDAKENVALEKSYSDVNNSECTLNFSHSGNTPVRFVYTRVWHSIAFKCSETLSPKTIGDMHALLGGSTHPMRVIVTRIMQNVQPYHCASYVFFVIYILFNYISFNYYILYEHQLIINHNICAII